MKRIDLLAQKCNTVLLMLINLYEKSEINEKTFIDNSNIKISFLTSHINLIEDQKIRSSSLLILEYYEKMNIKNTTSELACSTQV